MSQSFESLVERVSPAVVEIFVSGYGADESEHGKTSSAISRQKSLGSGVIVDPDGYIVTNYHVVEGAQRVNVLITPRPDSESQVNAALRPQLRALPAKVLGFSKSADLAVLKVDATGLPTVPFARYTAVRQGELVLAIGNPEGLQNTVTMGLVSSVMRQVDPDSPMVYIQTDAAINPGNSGGALVDMEGNLVGINSSIFTQSGGSEGLGFAIPSGIVRFVYQQIRQYGRVRRPGMGIDVQSVTASLAEALRLPTESGVIVADVVPGGPAASAGLKISDLIESIDGAPVANASSFAMDMYLLQIGEPAHLGIVRDGKKLTLDVPVTEENPGVEQIADLIDPEKDLISPLGVFGIPLTAQVAALIPEPRINSGVVVAGTTSNDRSGDIGLQVGDIIHQVNAASVNSVDALRGRLRSQARGPGRPPGGTQRPSHVPDLRSGVKLASGTNNMGAPHLAFEMWDGSSTHSAPKTSSVIPTADRSPWRMGEVEEPAV
jgi:serine protease Do